MARTSKLLTVNGKKGKTSKDLGAAPVPKSKDKELGSYKGKAIIEAGKVNVNGRELNQIKLSDGSISILTDEELAE